MEERRPSISGHDKIEVILFDVNETLLDINALQTFFVRVFDDPAVLRVWFAELILYSQTMTISGLYAPFEKLAIGTLRMVAANHHITITDAEEHQFADLMGALPPHADVAPALECLQNAGFRMATLTNSAPSEGVSPLERAGLDHFFESQFSVDAIRRFKPHPDAYRYAAGLLGVEPRHMCLVACHLWDTIGAQTAGCYGAFVTRPNNNILAADAVPLPNFVAPALGVLADELIAAKNKPPELQFKLKGKIS